MNNKSLQLLFCSVAVLTAACGGSGGGTSTSDTAGSNSPTGSDGSTATAASWTVVALENQAFTLGSARVVRYGTADTWVHKTVTGGGNCTNSFFGSDPVVGASKRCEAQADETAAAAPSPSASPAPAPAASPSPAASPAPAVAAPTLGNSLGSARVMISGHSLTDDPIGAYMQSIAQSLGTSMAWNEQIVLGSPIRVRTRGNDVNDASFSGYRTGKNRSGSNMNVVAELASPQTIGGERYDTLLLAERHDLAGTLMWEDTVRYARHFHDRLAAGNANANTYLYHAWLDLSSKDDPSAWIAYERAAAPAWQCVAARINVSLAAEGRAGRVAYLPAGLALANLVEQASRGGVAGVSGGGTRATLDRLFSDNVHMTSLGSYYMALVSYSSIYRRSPVGAWVPPGVTGEQAGALQNLAWQSVAGYYNSASTPSMAQCQATMRDQYCAAYGSYTANGGMVAGCVSRFGTQSQDNPFYYNAGSDSGYWFPAPR